MGQVRDGSLGKGACCYAEQPEFNFQSPHGGMRVPTPTCCPLTFIVSCCNMGACLLPQSPG